MSSSSDGLDDRDIFGSPSKSPPPKRKREESGGEQACDVIDLCSSDDESCEKT
jgi:hypothetical protein